MSAKTDVPKTPSICERVLEYQKKAVVEHFLNRGVNPIPNAVDKLIKDLENHAHRHGMLSEMEFLKHLNKRLLGASCHIQLYGYDLELDCMLVDTFEKMFKDCSRPYIEAIFSETDKKSKLAQILADHGALAIVPHKIKKVYKIIDNFVHEWVPLTGERFPMFQPRRLSTERFIALYPLKAHFFYKRIRAHKIK